MNNFRNGNSNSATGLSLQGANPGQGDIVRIEASSKILTHNKAPAKLTFAFRCFIATWPVWYIIKTPINGSIQLDPWRAAGTMTSTNIAITRAYSALVEP